MRENTWHEIYVICAAILSVPVFFTNFSVFVATFVILNSTREDLRVATILLGNIAFADMCMPLSILFGLFFPQRSTLLCAMELVLSPLIITTNLAVLISSKLLLCCIRRKPVVSIVDSGRANSLVFLGNLALADIALAILFPLRHLFPQVHQQNVGCVLEKGATVACTLTSMCCIVLIAVDRYFFIVHSIRYDHYMTETRARVLINLSWFLGILFGFVPVMVKAIYKTEEGTHCRFVTPENVDIMLIAGVFALPLLVATFALYMAIYLKARTVSKAMWPGIQKSRVQQLKTRSVIIVFLSSSCFLLTWGPYLVSLMIYGSFCERNETSDREEVCTTLEELMGSPLPMLGFLNSFINPIIFAWWHRPFTRALYEIFCPVRSRIQNRTRSVDISTITTNS